jgi:methyltransferase (TIGR00027 family)
VVLGAGLDTFAFRNPHQDHALRVFEVDHPSTQVWKRRLLAGAGIPVPASLAFVPVDFERDSLPERLASCGFDASAPACFSWLGVSMYLTREAVRSTLAFVGARPAGSSITFDYLLPPSSLPFLRRIGFHLLAHRLALAGEPWRTWFAPAELARELHALGFTQLEDLDSAALNLRYFGGRAKELGGRSAGHVMVARRSAEAGGQR